MAGTWKQWEGRVIGEQFQLGQYLAGSDHSAVFLTQRGNQKAAIKLVPADNNAEQQLSRWAAAAEFCHPHLIPLLERGHCELGDSKLLYLVMEYADENLSQVLPQRPLTPRETWEMLPPILEALAYLHARGFAHAGLKPGNIMAVEDRLKLSSDNARAFGEAKRGARTPGDYDAPEVAMGGVSPASDVWSLGMTLIEVLTQRRPERDRLLAPEAILPVGTPEPFLEIARHCLLPEPERRWSVAEIAARLQASAPVPAKQVPPQETSASPYWVPVLVVGLIVASILVVPRLRKRESRSEPGSAVVAGQPAPPAKPAAATPSPATRHSSDAAKNTSATTAAPATPPLAVSTSAVNTPGAVVDQVLPRVPQSARDTIQGRIRVHVKVAVDPSGQVLKAKLDSSGPSQYFARLALKASERWKFAPPRVNGQAVPSEWMLRFQFENTATKVFPTQTSP